MYSLVWFSRSTCCNTMYCVDIRETKKVAPEWSEFLLKLLAMLYTQNYTSPHCLFSPIWPIIPYTRNLISSTDLTHILLTYLLFIDIAPLTIGNLNIKDLSTTNMKTTNRIVYESLIMKKFFYVQIVGNHMTISDTRYQCRKYFLFGLYSYLVLFLFFWYFVGIFLPRCFCSLWFIFI